MDRKPFSYWQACTCSANFWIYLIQTGQICQDWISPCKKLPIILWIFKNTYLPLPQIPTYTSYDQGMSQPDLCVCVKWNHAGPPLEVASKTKVTTPRMRRIIAEASILNWECEIYMITYHDKCYKTWTYPLWASAQIRLFWYATSLNSVRMFWIILHSFDRYTPKRWKKKYYFPLTRCLIIYRFMFLHIGKR